MTGMIRRFGMRRFGLRPDSVVPVVRGVDA